MNERRNMSITNDWILITCTFLQIPLGLISLYCVPNHLIQLVKNFWPNAGVKGHKLSFSLAANSFLNYTCSLAQLLICVYQKSFGALWYFYIFVPILYSLIYYMMIAGSLRKMFPPRGVPVWDSSQLNGTTVRQVSFYWEPSQDINFELEPSEECNICFEHYVARFKPQYSCLCIHKQICYKCIIQQLMVSRTCPWCRQDINELHIKMF